jgi:Meckel syndrome type 1 protein
MTTDRTQTARPAALTDRPSAASAERRPDNAFAALLDAQAPAPRDPQPRDAAPRQDEPSGTPAQADAGAQEQPQAERPAPAPVAAVVDSILGPVALPAETPAPATAAPAVPTAPLFMLAPEAVAVAAPVAPQPAAVAPVPAAPAEAAAPAPLPVAAPTAPVATTPPVEEAPAAPVAPQPAPAAAPQPVAPEARKAEAAPVVAAAPVVPETPVEAPAAAPARAAAAPEPAPAPAPAQAPASAPVAQAPMPAPAAGLAAPERAVPLHRAPAAVATLLHVAVDRGISHAKMALRPAELGGIEIRLQATAGGVAAQVVADSPEAARMLAQAGDDLRRALEARDVTLISLEVSTSSDQRQQSARGEWTDGGDAGLTSSHGRTAGDAEGDAEPAPITQTVIELPGGLLVDVLA